MLDNVAMNYERPKQTRIFENGVLRITMHQMAWFFFFSIFFMPDYFGLNIGFAFNSQRIAMILIWIWIFRVNFRKREFVNVLFGNKNNIVFALYLIVCFYTAVLRVDIGTFLNPLIDNFMVLYTTIYFFKTEFTLDEFLKQIAGIGYVLCVLGIFEYMTKKSIFSYFTTIPNMYAGAFYRDGAYRIMGPAHHSLGYGLFLLIILPLICINRKENRLDLFYRLPLTLLIILNIYLTGSRSTLGIMLLELAMIFLFSGMEEKKKTLLLGGLVFIILLLLMILLIRNSAVQAIWIRFTSAIDSAFGTTLSRDLFDYYSKQLTDSATYRTYLPKIFHLEWLNPWLGRGNNYAFGWFVDGYSIQSIDNYYVSQYIKIAYPGLVTLILVFLANIRYAMINSIRSKNVMFRACLIIFITYFVNLWWVDVLGTLDYIFVLFGILYVMNEEITKRSNR